MSKFLFLTVASQVTLDRWSSLCPSSMALNPYYIRALSATKTRYHLHGDLESIKLFLTKVNYIICSHRYTLSVKYRKY